MEWERNRFSSILAMPSVDSFELEEPLNGIYVKLGSQMNRNWLCVCCVYCTGRMSARVDIDYFRFETPEKE